MGNSSLQEIPPDALNRTRGFVGREWVLEAVDDWIAHESERYLLIVGEPGWGKTALAAWLAGAGPVPDDADAARRLERVRERWDSVHFCIGRNQEGTTDPAQFARELAEQLDHLDGFAQALIREVAPTVDISITAQLNAGQIIGAHIDQLNIPGQDPGDVYNRLVRQPLRTLARSRPGDDLKVLILVDALDEALTADGTNIVSLIAGSGDLPPGVRFVLTSRDEPRVLDKFDDRTVERALYLGQPQYTANAERDLGRYISGRIATDDSVAALPAGDPAELAAKLLDQADGNFLYARWVLDEAAQGLPTDFTALPKGLYGLYRRFLERLVLGDGSAWRTKHEPFLGCLTVATPVAPGISLPQWLDLPAGTLSWRVRDVAQIIEYVAEPPEGEDGYRLYHRSVTDFLSAYQYGDKSRPRLNEYYIEPVRQHDRIASYYLDQIRGDWAGDWSQSDSYGLRQLVGHLRARAELAESGQRARAGELYQVMLDDRFQAAQHERLNGIHTTLNDLRITLAVALGRDSAPDLLAALRCIAGFRGLTAAESLSNAVFDAVVADDIPRAARKMSHYLTGPASSTGWQQVLKLYLAWEAAESGDPRLAQDLVPEARFALCTAIEPLCDALIARIAGDTSAIAERLPPHELRSAAAEAEQLVARLEQTTDEGDAEAVSSRMFIRQMYPVDPETVAGFTASIAPTLSRIAAHRQGQDLIARALRSISRNPYPRYRDISLGALAAAVMASPDRRWVRDQMRQVLRAGLDDEGITFTFDLPMTVLAECRRRDLPAQALEAYLGRAADRDDVWGTRIRALSAQASAAYRSGDVMEAFGLLREASGAHVTYAGYGVTAMLGLIDRCHEFGEPYRAEVPEWGPARDQSLPGLAAHYARDVYDPEFRQERLNLVRLHQGWTEEPRPDAASVEQRLAATTDTDVRRAYQHHVAARWAASPGPEIAKVLVPLALFDTTGLDAILASLLVGRLRALDQADFLTVADLVTAHFTSGRPWTHGQWR